MDELTEADRDLARRINAALGHQALLADAIKACEPPIWLPDRQAAILFNFDGTVTIRRHRHD